MKCFAFVAPVAACRNYRSSIVKVSADGSHAYARACVYNFSRESNPSDNMIGRNDWSLWNSFHNYRGTCVECARQFFIRV